MRKQVCYGLMLLLGAVTFLSSCGNDTDYFDSNAASKLQHNKFAETFENAFGKVAPNVNWGFSDTEATATTRALTRGEALTDNQICALSIAEIEELSEADKRAYLRQLVEHDVNIGIYLTIGQLNAFGFKRIICEDLNVSDNSDFDYNDAVFDAKRMEEAGSGEYATFYTILRAEGAHKLITIGNAEGAYEVHEAFGVTKDVFINTVRKERKTNNGAYWKKDHDPVVKVIEVRKRGDGTEPTLIDIPVYAENNYLPLTAKKGEPAEKICVTTDYSWLEERKHMESWYPKFTHYVTGEAKINDNDAFGNEESWWYDIYWETPESNNNDPVMVEMIKVYEATTKLPIDNTTFGTVIKGERTENGEYYVEFDEIPTIVAENAFKDQDALTKMFIPEGVVTIDDNAFSGCSNLSEVTLPNTLTTIDTQAFKSCESLTGITIPDNVRRIGESSFENCTGLTSITLPKSVVYINKNAFKGCTSLTNFAIDHESELTTINEGSFYGCSNLTAVSLPTGLEDISNNAFYGCSSLGSINLSSTRVEIIRASAFYGCTCLTSISFPASLGWIEYCAFSDCKNITSIDFSKVRNIGEMAFIRCSGLTTITLPSDLKSIGSSAFASCSNLTTVTCNATTPPTAVHDMFSDCSKLQTIYVPAASVDAYKAADGWSNYANKIVAIQD